MDNGLNIDYTYLLSFIESDDDDDLYLFYEKEKGFFLYEKNGGHATFAPIDKCALEEGFPQVYVIEDLHGF